MKTATSRGVPLPTNQLPEDELRHLITCYEDALNQAATLHYALRRPLNARHYYPAGPGNYTRATEALGAHILALGDIRQYLEEHLLHLQEALPNG